MAGGLIAHIGAISREAGSAFLALVWFLDKPIDSFANASSLYHSTCLSLHWVLAYEGCHLFWTDLPFCVVSLP